MLEFPFKAVGTNHNVRHIITVLKANEIYIHVSVLTMFFLQLFFSIFFLACEQQKSCEQEVILRAG